MTYTHLYLMLTGLAGLMAGGGVSFLVYQQLRCTTQKQLEEEAENRANRRLAEGERTQRLALLEEKDAWYRQKREQEEEDPHRPTPPEPLQQPGGLPRRPGSAGRSG